MLEVPLTVTGNLNVTSNESRIIVTFDDKPVINVSGMETCLLLSACIHVFSLIGTAELRGTLVVNLVNDTLGPRTIIVGYVGNLTRPFDTVEIVSSNVCIASRGEFLEKDSRSLSVLLRQSDATAGCGGKKKKSWLVAVIVVGGVLLLALLVGVLAYVLYRFRVLNKLWHSYEVNA